MHNEYYFVEAVRAQAREERYKKTKRLDISSETVMEVTKKKKLSINLFSEQEPRLIVYEYY